MAQWVEALATKVGDPSTTSMWEIKKHTGGFCFVLISGLNEVDEVLLAKTPCDSPSQRFSFPLVFLVVRLAVFADQLLRVSQLCKTVRLSSRSLCNRNPVCSLHGCVPSAEVELFAFHEIPWIGWSLSWDPGPFKTPRTHMMEGDNPQKSLSGLVYIHLT